MKVDKCLFCQSDIEGEGFVFTHNGQTVGPFCFECYMVIILSKDKKEKQEQCPHERLVVDDVVIGGTKYRCCDCGEPVVIIER